jgi:predicted dehydrogenase
VVSDDFPLNCDMQKPIKVGVVGYGMAAQVMHLPFLTTLPSYQVVSILERHHAHSQEKYPWVRVVKTIDELVSDPEIDLIVITTPNDTHFPYSKQALLAGKNVVVEKPFTLDSADAAVLIELSKKTGKTLTVFHNRRYVNDFLTIREILAKKLLGKKIVEFEAHYDRYRPAAKPNAWREENIPGSGIFFDLGAHLIDQVLCLFGPPKTLQAAIRLQRPHARVNDYFDLRMDYGFLRVILKGGMLVREPGPRYMIHGTDGSFIKYGEDPQEPLLKTGVLPNIPHWGEESPEQWGLLHTEKDGQVIKERYPSLPGHYAGYYEDLAATLLEGAPLKVRPEQAYNTMRILELAEESSRSGCSVEVKGLMETVYE